MISSSCTVKDGVMTVTIANCSLHEEAQMTCDIHGFKAKTAVARILTQDVHAFNDFQDSDRVKIEDYTVEIADDVMKVTLPPCSIVEVSLQ